VPYAALLIADADKNTARTFRPLLHSGGYTVLTTDSGPQALDIMAEQRPQLVILGERVRHADSLTICQQIKGDESLGYVPVIWLSSCKEDLSREGENGPDAILCRPIDPVILQDWLWALLGVKRQFDQRLQKLASGSRTIEMLKTDIITSVSHELGTPLLQVKSAVALLTEDMNQGGTREQRSIASMATQAVARLEGVVNNIRQLARARDIQLAPVVVHEAADLAIRFLERSWTSRGAHDRIQNNIPDDLPLVIGDKRALGHLLQLLLDNALKFSPPHAPVYLQAMCPSPDQVWVGVQDFGIGIASEEHKRIFEAFYQVNGGANRAYNGTGTGLTLAMLLAKGMNTEIKLASTPGEGSTFSFVLPVADLGLD
jgi:signal transduction histidine kinase